MSTEIKVPVLPESVADATILTWQKKPGDAVKRDEVLVEVETDKVVLEVPAPADGVLVSIVADEGAVVTAEELLGTIDEGASAPAEAQSAAAVVSSTPAATGGATSPSVRQMLAENNLSEGEISGSGKDGRIIKADVEAHLGRSARPTPAAPPAAPEAVAPAASPAATSAPVTDAGDRTERRVPMSRLRARIAERLLHASQSTAMLTTFNEVDMQPVKELRAQYKDQFEKAHGVRLGFMSIFVKAATEALKRFPDINASIDGDDVVYHGYCDIGIAVSSERGLVVPVIRDAEHLSLAGIETQIGEYAVRAKEGKLGLEDLTGGTFTITNGGVFGSLMSTPILNPPQSAILGMHAMQDRPVAINGEVVIRPMMYIALSYDHRIVDGQGAVTFLKTIKELVEEPAKILLDI
ncbi:dihydrolipoamide succinyltransferase [Chromatiales bacterium (ex Bugula neritina AB1)]|nr:dihydrolipoamide succinyltransferase [Chromatiales bacterium (ex Bugula neritina AB1)]